MLRKLAIGAIFVAAAATTVIAQSEGPFDGVIKARQGYMDLNGLNIGVLGAMAQDKAPYDAAAASAAAGNLLALSMMNTDILWPEGSDSAANANTRALPAAFTDVEGRKTEMAAFMAAATAMNAAAGNGLDALKGAMGGLGAACGACHKAYRQSQ